MLVTTAICFEKQIAVTSKLGVLALWLIPQGTEHCRSGGLVKMMISLAVNGHRSSKYDKKQIKEAAYKILGR